MSNMPSPNASRRNASSRSGQDGNSFGASCSVSRYSQMTGESYNTLPSSSTSVGIFPSGFSRISATCGVVPPTTVRIVSIRSVSPSSCATIITLRT